MISDEVIAKRIAYDICSGYWQVAGKYFFSKADCLRYATRINRSDVTYHFFDDVYKNIRWDIEPDESLEQLYAARAKHLREKYDYIAIAFSGGVDSTNMVKAFLKNNLRIDEIVSFYPVEASEKLIGGFDRTNKHASNIIFEYFEAVVPAFKWLADHHPNIKLTTLDYTRRAIEIVKGDKLLDITMSGITSQAMTCGIFTFTDYLKQYGPRCCQLVGIDKPRMRFNKLTRRFESYFHDFNNVFGHWTEDIFDGAKPTLEYFYHSYDSSRLVVKQCHEIKKVLEKLDIDPYNSSFPGLFETVEKAGPNFVFVNVQHDLIKKIIYPDCDLTVYQANKQTNHMYHAEHNQWFLDYIKTDKRMDDFYAAQIEDIMFGVHPSFIERAPDGKPLKMRACITKPNPL